MSYWEVEKLERPFVGRFRPHLRKERSWSAMKTAQEPVLYNQAFVIKRANEIKREYAAHIERLLEEIATCWNDSEGMRHIGVSCPNCDGALPLEHSSICQARSLLQRTKLELQDDK